MEVNRIMSRSHKKFPCFKAYLSDGKKMTNKKFRSMAKDKMRHQEYDSLPINYKRFARYDVYEYRDILYSMTSKGKYYPANRHNWNSIYRNIGIQTDIDRLYFYNNSIDYTKLGFYKLYFMK